MNENSRTAYDELIYIRRETNCGQQPSRGIKRLIEQILIELIENSSLHTPLFDVDWSIWTTLGLALICGAALSLLFGSICEGEFSLWGFCNGYIGFLFFWLILTFLPVKWSLVVTAAVALPIGVLFYFSSRVFDIEVSVLKSQQALQKFIETPSESRQDASKKSDSYYNTDDSFYLDSVYVKTKYNTIKYNALAMLIVGYISLGVILLGTFRIWS